MSDRFITRYFLRFKASKIPSKKILLYDKCKKVGTIINLSAIFVFKSDCIITIQHKASAV